MVSHLSIVTVNMSCLQHTVAIIVMLLFFLQIIVCNFHMLVVVGVQFGSWLVVTCCLGVYLFPGGWLTVDTFWPWPSGVT